MSTTAVHRVSPKRCRTSVLSVGASPRAARTRKYFALLPEQLAERIGSPPPGEGYDLPSYSGREARTGDRRRAQPVAQGVKIPTSEAFPSLNLSQAVQIITYTLYRS
jgi:tRNA/rRNA methyltransferase